jgi:putative phosphoesterase
MKVGVISDIHDNIPNLLKSIEILNQEKVGKVYFCGDLTSPFTLKFFKGLKAPVKAVYGNNEGDKLRIPERIKKHKLNMEYGEKEGLFFEDKADGLRIAVFHGHVYQISEALARDSYYNLLLTGHTHEAHIKKLKNKIWINPGSICGFSEKIFNKPSFALFDTSKKIGKMINL